MKNLKYLIVAASVALLPACNNNLDEEVFSEVTEQTYNYQSAYEAMGIVYANMRSFFSHTNYYMAQETTADAIVQPANASGWDDGGIYKRMHLHTWNSENPQMANMWNSFYRGALNANRVIRQLETDVLPIPSNASKESLLAEMKVARAFFYWMICDNFGDAPLVTEPTSELPSKSSRKEIYQFIVNEINAALPHLTAEKNQALYGRFNKWAAKALLANVYLNAEVYAGESKWNEVIAECNDIINSGVYRLDEYRSIFKTVNDGSPEIIFAVPFDENLATGLSTHLYSWHGALNRKVNMQSTPWGSGSAMGITQFIDTYDQDDQRLEDTWLMGPQYALDGVTPLLGTYDQAGKHLIFTKELPDGMYTGEAEGYRMNKFEVKVGAMGSLSNDIPFFRYAQVLLMKAEGLLRTGKQDEAAALVTEVRLAHGFANSPAKAVVTGAELLQDTRYQYGYVENYNIVDRGDTSPVQFGRFLDELGWEFAWEGHRRRDLIRFGVYTTKSWLSHKPNGAHRITFPLPQQAINSNPNLTQNSGY